MPATLPRRLRIRCVSILLAAATALPAARVRGDLTLRIADYVKAPITGSVSSISGNSVYLARLNFMAEEPGVSKNRFFVNDLNGSLNILDQQTKQFSTYLNFNGLAGNPIGAGMFRRFTYSTGFANGLITFQFDPAYATNGKFYTVHMETVSGTQLTPVNPPPGFITTGYTTTTSVPTPLNEDENPARRTVLIEWTDTNINNATFEGTARELLRMDMSGSIHPMGDIIFNPNAGPTHPDWRMMYISIGDGSAGESNSGGAAAASETRPTPQRLDALGGKILRIRPDNVGANTTLTASPNARYYIPTNNPFTGISDPTVRDEIFALGLRNPHRVSWDADTDTLLANDIGLHTWEEVNIVESGRNFGYSTIEGNQYLGSSNENTSTPLPATIPLKISATTTAGNVTPIYPVAQFGHGNADQPGLAGDSITSGFVYRGANIPSLFGKYVFGDITTGQLMWSDIDELIAADDGDPNTMAEIHTIDVLWNNPDDPDGEQLYETITTPVTPGNSNDPAVQVRGPLHQIVDLAYHERGGEFLPSLPGFADVTDPLGRADIRWQVDNEGELYLLSKSDGVIRYIVEAVGDADFNGDDRIDGNDFLIWQQNVGSDGGLALGDADGDGRVTNADLGFWKQQAMPGSPAGAVPEPAAAALAALALVGLPRRRWRRGARSSGPLPLMGRAREG